MVERLGDIPKFKTWREIEKIEYGWSSDDKYYIEDDKHEKFLLRISQLDSYKQKKKEFEIIQKFNTLNFPMSKAMDFGYVNNKKNVYMLLSWVEGQTLGKVIQNLSKEEQYNLGVEAGIILKSIHSLTVEGSDIPKLSKISKKLLQLNLYEESSVRIPNDEIAISYVRENIDRLYKLPAVYEHGDFHLGNLIYTPECKIGVIDFNRWECGDRFEEFYKIQSFDVEVSIPFSVGEIHGYFNGEPPIDFWEIQAVYVAHASLYSIKWAEKFGIEEINGMKKRCLDAFSDYDNFNEIIPKWYQVNKNTWRK